jgi:nucleotide-binding universal stress UspA family protein
MYNSLLLPVSNPKNSEYTLRAALKLLNPNGKIIILGIVKAQESFPEKNASYRNKTNLVLKLTKMAQSVDKEVIPEVMNTTSISEAILDQMAKYEIDLTILGYSLQSRLYKLRHGDVIYPVIKNASTEILLSNFKYESNFETILIPSAGYSHSIKAFEIAKTLAARVNGRITLLHITEEGESHTQNYLKKLASTYSNSSIEVKSGAVAEQIIELAKDYDLLMMGASERPRGLQIVFGTVVDKVMEEATCNIFVVKV